MGLLLPAVVLLLLGRGSGALPASLGAVKRQSRAPFLHQGSRRHTACIAFWPHPQPGECLWQEREQRIEPVVGLGVTHRTLQRMHRLQGMRLLIDQNKQKLIFHAL
jgi:hypothetical protein